MTFSDVFEEAADSYGSTSGEGGGIFGGVTGGGALKSLGSIFSGIGDFQEAKSYGNAAKLAEQNAVLSGFFGKIKETQAQRQISLVKGQEIAGYSAGNLAISGSAAAVVRNTLQQGALQKAIINMQTTQQMNAYTEEAKQFQRMQHMGVLAGIGNLINGVGSFFGL